MDGCPRGVSSNECDASRLGRIAISESWNAWASMEEFETLLNAAQQSDPDAIRAIMGAFRSIVQSVCHEFDMDDGGDLSRSDLVQTVWTKVLTQLPTFEVRDAHGAAAQFRSWLKTTAKRALSDLFRARTAKKRRPKRLERMDGSEPIAQGDSPSQAAAGAELADHIAAALEQLDAESQSLVKMAFYDQMSLYAIAEELGLTYSQCRTRLGRAIEELRFILGKNFRP